MRWINNSGAAEEENELVKPIESVKCKYAKTTNLASQNVLLCT